MNESTVDCYIPPVLSALPLTGTSLGTLTNAGNMIQKQKPAVLGKPLSRRSATIDRKMSYFFFLSSSSLYVLPHTAKTGRHRF